MSHGWKMYMMCPGNKEYVSGQSSKIRYKSEKNYGNPRELCPNILTNIRVVYPCLNEEIILD